MSEIRAEVTGTSEVRAEVADMSEVRAGRDPVNLPMIRTWLEAMGDANPVYERDQVAPPAMIQVWTMRGLAPAVAGDPLGDVSEKLAAEGYSGVVATDSSQTYRRPLRIGEEVAVRSRLESVTGPKKTSLGEGFFVTTVSTWLVGDEPVGEMTFRILRYKPSPKQPASPPEKPPGDRASAGREKLRPVVTADNAFFWEGIAVGELRLQRCEECGELRHPPGPVCPACGSFSLGYEKVPGTGRIHSFVVHHHPPVPGRRPPFVVALVDLDQPAAESQFPGEEGVESARQRPSEPRADGVPQRPGNAGDHPRKAGDERQSSGSGRGSGPPIRMVAEFLGSRPEIGDAVRVGFEDGLPVWRPDVPVLEPWVLQVTPTLVVSAALATRDHQNVHHDRDAAIRLGSRDIFLNILTTTGLVQRFVTDRLGAGTRIAGIRIRLGAPCHAYDTLTFTGRVLPHGVEVSGRTAEGLHVSGLVEVVL